MTFSQNFSKIEKLIGKGQADRVFEVLNTIGLESIDNQPSTLQLAVFWETDNEEEDITYYPVKEDEELSENNMYLLNAVLPENGELKIDFSDLEFSIEININGVSYSWSKDADDKTNCPTSELFRMVSGNNSFRTSYAMSEERNSFFIQLVCNDFIKVNLNCTCESFINTKGYNNKQKPIEELDTILDAFLSYTEDRNCYEYLKYEEVKKLYTLMRDAILNTANYLRQANGLPTIEWKKKERTRVLTREQIQNYKFY